MAVEVEFNPGDEQNAEFLGRILNHARAENSAMCGDGQHVKMKLIRSFDKIHYRVRNIVVEISLDVNVERSFEQRMGD